MGYYKVLPPELQEHYIYEQDGGHAILAIPECLLPEAEKTRKYDDYTASIPVKYVLETGYRMAHGKVIVNAPYDEDFGVDVDDRYYEYGTENEGGDLLLKIGEVYPQFAIGVDSARLIPSPMILNLVLTYRNPTKTEIHSVEQGEIKIETITVDDIPFLLLKIGSLPWAKAPYDPYRSECPLMAIPIGAGYPLHIYFADADKGTLLAYRIYTMHEKTSHHFVEACEHFVYLMLSANEYDRRLSKIYAQYTTATLVKKAQENN